jgi:ATP-dependent DNA ligase
MMVRRNPAGVRLLTRNGHDWTGRFPLIAQAAGALRARSFLIDGEAVACDGDGLPVFDRLRYRRLGSPYRSGRSRDWLKMKNRNAPAVKREAEEDWGRKKWR